MSEAASTSAPPGSGPHQRRLRNYLLNRRFQLKYSGYLVGIATLVSVCLGTVLWRTSEAGIAQSKNAVAQGEQVVERGREVLKESQKVSAVVQMNIVRDPVYGQNPALLEAFGADAAEQDARLLSQQRALEAQARALKQQSADLVAQQHRMFLTLCVALGLLVVLTGLAGIVVTHKVAGPVFKMKRQLAEVGAGRLTLPTRLRRGDELVDFFEVFEAMVKSLRERQEAEILELESAMGSLAGKAEPSELAPLERLRDRMRAALD